MAAMMPNTTCKPAGTKIRGNKNPQLRATTTPKTSVISSNVI